MDTIDFDVTSESSQRRPREPRLYEYRCIRYGSGGHDSIVERFIAEDYELKAHGPVVFFRFDADGAMVCESMRDWDVIRCYGQYVPPTGEQAL